MGAKHTQGPWVIWSGHLTVMAGPLLENRPGLARGGRGTICELEDDLGDIPMSQQRANARLIAAAPELLDAAPLALVALTRAGDAICADPNHDPSIMASVELARRALVAAIAKARGDS